MADFTLGIEEEFQIIDPETRELRSHITEMIDEGRMLLGEQVKPEMHQSMIEIGTGICDNIQEARADLIKLRRTISTSRGNQGPPHRRSLHPSFLELEGSEDHSRSSITRA